MTGAIPTVALSVRQPWAFALAQGWKDIENRDWQPNNSGLRFRGSFLIHASAWWNTDEVRADLYWCAGVAQQLGFSLPEGITLRRLKEQTGGIVGQAVMRDVVERSSSPWFFGRWGLVIGEQKPLPFVPCKGTTIPAFWPVPANVLAELASARAA